MYLYYFFAAVSCWFGLQSLLGGFRFVAYVRREMSRTLPEYSPFVSILAPGRGLEDGLEENIRVLLTQEYPAYEILFIFDRDEDPAIELVRRLSQSIPNIPARIVIAGPSSDRGQKVHNLSVAVDEVSLNTEVLVFVDTDARPDRRWLRELVAPLIDPALGASTGYRWFVPLRGGFASRLRSVWNASIASALGADRSKNFCWGGSTAIRRETFERVKIKERWRGTVSDDFLITTVMKENKLPVHFTPHCLVPSVGDCDLGELFEFTTRQIKITRVYASQLWLPLLLGSSLFCLVFFGGLILLAVRIALGFSWLVLALVLLLVFLLGAVKAFIRLRAVLLPLKRYEREVKRDLPAHIMLWPVASLLYLYNAITAGFSRVINWRGITYELKSPIEAVIISRKQS
jgi:ceramide glucosyltransferase